MTDQGLTELVPVVVFKIAGASWAVPREEKDRFVIVESIRTLPGLPRGVYGIALVNDQPRLAIELEGVIGEPDPMRQTPRVEPPVQALECAFGKERILLIGGQVVFVGSLRKAGDGAVEWKGAVVPLLATAQACEAALNRREAS